MSIDDRWAPEDEFDIRQIWGVVSKNKWVIISVPVVLAGLVAAAVSFIRPTFDAASTVLIENVDANIVSIEEVYGLQRRNDQYYATQYEVLRSRPLAEKVVRQSNLTRHPEFALERAGTPRWKFWSNWFGAGEDRVVLDPEQHAVIVYMEKLRIVPAPRTQLVHVHFESNDPELAARMANAHAQAYIESLMEARLSMTGTAISWMTAKLEDLQTSLLESEQRLQEYKERFGVIDYEGLKALPNREVADLTSKLVEARQIVTQTRATYFQVFPGGGTELAEGLDETPAAMEDQLYREYQLTQNELQNRVDELSKRLRPSHPTLIDAEAALARAKQNVLAQERRIAERIRNEFEAAVVQEDELAAALERAKAQYQAIGRREAEFLALQREVETNRELHDMFYNRIKETAQTGDLRQAEARVLSPAVVPIRPISPNRKVAVGMAFSASLLLTVFAAFVVEAFNDKVDVLTIEKRLGVPLLSMVPRIEQRKHKKSLANLLTDEGNQAYKEALRTLRTGIAMHAEEELTKIVLLTSAFRDEGKTSLAMNLAHAFGQMENVLLIDADLRNPSIAHRLAVPEQGGGLVALLSKTASLEDCIVSTENDKLDVLPAGSVPDDPLQLLASRPLASALRVLRVKYDRIIIDSPPVLPASDAAVLSAHVDTVVLVAKSKSSRLMHVKAALAKLRRVAAPVIGVVVNQWDTREQKEYDVYGYNKYYEHKEDHQPRRATG